MALVSRGTFRIDTHKGSVDVVRCAVVFRFFIYLASQGVMN